MRLTTDGRLKTCREELIAKARKSFWRIWGLGLGGGVLSAGGAANLWEIVVRPVLEYAAELGKVRWGEAERLQLMAGRMCLGVGRAVANEVVSGELGWWSVEGRRRYLRLVYWAKVVRGGDSIVRAVYKEGRERKGGVKGWCEETKRVLEEVGLGWVWENEEVGEEKEWKRVVRRAVGEYEEREWQGRMVGRGVGKAKVKLDMYVRVKKELKKEWFLEMDRAWVSRWVRMRAGVSRVEVEMGRYRRVRRGDRVCRWCGKGKVEDVVHVVVECERWKEKRRELWGRVMKDDEVWGRLVRGKGRREMVECLLKGGGRKVRDGVMKGVTGLMYMREKEGDGGDWDKKVGRKRIHELVGDKSFREVMKVRMKVGGKVTTEKVEKWMRKRAGGEMGRRKECVRWECAREAGRKAAEKVENMRVEEQEQQTKEMAVEAAEEVAAAVTEMLQTAMAKRGEGAVVEAEEVAGAVEEMVKKAMAKRGKEAVVAAVMSAMEEAMKAAIV